MIQTIKEKIVTILKTVDDIVQVFEYAVDKATGYPFAYVIWAGQEATEITNREDRVTDTYSIKLVQEKLEDFKTKKQAEITVNNRIEAILTKFREKYTLDGMVLKTTPINVTKDYGDGSTRIITNIEIKTERIVQIN